MEYLTLFDYLGIMSHEACLRLFFALQSVITRKKKTVLVGLSVSSRAEKNAQRKDLTPSHPT